MSGGDEGQPANAHFFWLAIPRRDSFLRKRANKAILAARTAQILRPSWQEFVRRIRILT